MPFKKTNEDFINEANEKHNYKYDYSKADFLDRRIAGCIICHEKDENGVEHGEFHSKRERNIGYGQGCPICKKEKIDSEKYLLTDKWIEKFKTVHGERYDYSKVVYVDGTTPICIICKEHGEFWQSPKDHLSGRGCWKCGRINAVKNRTRTVDKFIDDPNKVHGNFYDYSKVEYINSKTKVTITCPEHGDFNMTPDHFLSGEGCRKCGIIKAAITRTKDFSLVLNESINSHDVEYDYSQTEYVNDKIPMRIICHEKYEDGSEDGEFWQTPNNHITKSQGCPICGRLKSDKNRRYTRDGWVKLAEGKHELKYDYSKVVYDTSSEKVYIICNEKDRDGVIHGEFWQKPSNHLMKQGCPKCFKEKSGIEKEVCAFIAELGIEFRENDRKLIKPKEIDIFIPSLNIGIEVNGLIWHSELWDTDKNYHINKTNACEIQNIKLIQIFEDEWNNKKEIVKSRLKNILGLTETKIYGRKCEIKEITQKEMADFLNENHVQGNVNAYIKIGLYNDNNLVSVMSFGKQRKALGSKSKDGVYELLRFCNKQNTTVNGGASKMLKYFINKYQPIEIISYADRRWSQGELYESIGFTFVKKYGTKLFLRCK